MATKALLRLYPPPPVLRGRVGEGVESRALARCPLSMRSATFAFLAPPGNIEFKDRVRCFPPCLPAYDRAPKSRAARVAVVVLVLACVAGGAPALGFGRGLFRGRKGGVEAARDGALLPAEQRRADRRGGVSCRRSFRSTATSRRSSSSTAPVATAPARRAPFNLLNYVDVAETRRPDRRRDRAALHAPVAARAAGVDHRRATPGSMGIASPGAAGWSPLQFAGERRLTPRPDRHDRKVVQQGAIEGEMTHLPPPPRFTEGWQLGEPDLVVEMPEAYTLPADGPDVYRDFVVPVNLTEAQWVRTIEFRPGNHRVVHHAFINFDDTRFRAGSRRRRRRLALTAWNCRESAYMPGGQLLGWQPGKNPPFLHRDWRGGWRRTPTWSCNCTCTRAGSRRRSCHKWDSILRTSRRRTPRFGSSWTTSRSISRPGVSDYADSEELRAAGGRRAAAHPSARALSRQGVAGLGLLPDGTRKWLIYIRNWDFNWQGDYRYMRSISLPRGTVLSVRRETYDNSEQNPHNPNHPPRRVVSGRRRPDEMGEFWLQVLTCAATRSGSISSATTSGTGPPGTRSRSRSRPSGRIPKDIEALINLGRALGVAGKDSERG